MSCEVLVRDARPWDLASRSTLLHDTLSEQNWDIFFQLYFQESTLQVLVLSCAALFIFGGVSLSVCALVPVAVALALRLLVSVAQHAHTDLLLADLRREEFGLVAVAAGAGAGAASVVGTVSVSRHRRAAAAGWLRAVAVRGRWRRGGVARALLGAARARALACGLTALETDVTCRQEAARALFQADGWEPRDEGGGEAGERAVAGGALSLQVQRFRIQLSSGGRDARMSPLHFIQIITENKRD